MLSGYACKKVVDVGSKFVEALDRRLNPEPIDNPILPVMREKSSLVDAVYTMAETGGSCPTLPFGYFLVDQKFLEAAFPDHSEVLLQMTAGKGFKVVLFYKGGIDGAAGQFVVAVRGTRLSSWSDITHNVALTLEKLGKKKRVTLLRSFVDELILRYGAENVHLTGHSLGASIVFIIARHLYLTQGRVGSKDFFFNLPFMRLEGFLSVLLEGCRIEYWFLRKFAYATKLDVVVEALLGQVKKASSNIFGKEQFLMQVIAEYQQLEGWTPYICINKYDQICNQYLRSFEWTQAGGAVPGVSAFTVLRECDNDELETVSEPFFVCPSANLIISNKGLTTYFAHKVHLWANVSPKRIEIRRCRSLEQLDRQVYLRRMLEELRR